MMITKRIIVQAAVAAVLFWIIKLILEKSTATETLIREGKIALLFGFVYAVYLVVRQQFRKDKGSEE